MTKSYMKYDRLGNSCALLLCHSLYHDTPHFPNDHTPVEENIYQHKVVCSYLEKSSSVQKKKNTLYGLYNSIIRL